MNKQTYNVTDENGNQLGGQTEIYIPENVTSDTPVYIVYPGGDESIIAGTVRNKYTNDPNFNGIVIIQYYADSIHAYEEGLEAQTIDFNRQLISSIEEQYGVTLNNRHVFGSSIGDSYALNDFAEQCKKGTDNGFLVIGSASRPDTVSTWRTEGYDLKQGNGLDVFDPSRAFLNEEDYAAIEGKSVILFDTRNAIENHTYIEQLVKHGVDVYLVEQGTDSHDGMSTNPLNDNLFGLLNGDEEATKEFLESKNGHGYVIKKCTDVDNYTWEEVNKTDFVAAIKNGNGGNKVLSDLEYVTSEMEKLKSLISGSPLLDNKKVTLPNGSTTTSPNINITIYNNFFNGINELSNKMSTEAIAIEKATEKYDRYL